MDREKAFSTIKELAELARKDGLTMLAIVQNDDSGLYTNAIVGSKDNLIKGMATLLMSFYEEMDADQRQDFVKAMKFTIENMDAMLLARALGMAVQFGIEQ